MYMFKKRLPKQTTILEINFKKRKLYTSRVINNVLNTYEITYFDKRAKFDTENNTSMEVLALKHELQRIMKYYNNEVKDHKRTKDRLNKIIGIK